VLIQFEDVGGATKRYWSKTTSSISITARSIWFNAIFVELPCPRPNIYNLISRMIRVRRIQRGAMTATRMRSTIWEGKLGKSSKLLRNSIIVATDLRIWPSHSYSGSR
jgi:hypothetical protein